MALRDPDGYDADIATWKQVRDGARYTVDELVDTLHHERYAGVLLYPVNTDARPWKQDRLPDQFDVPTYDHEAEEIQVAEADLDALIDDLEDEAPGHPGATLGDTRITFFPPRASFEHARSSLRRVQRYDTYTVTTR